jgi:hypothetical protein
MPNPSELNAKFSQFAKKVPQVGNCLTVTIPEISAALGNVNAGPAVEAFGAWADSQGLKAFPLNAEFVILARRI